MTCQQLCETKVQKNSTGNTLHSESNISTSQWRQRKYQWSLKSLMFIYSAPWLFEHKFIDLYNKAAGSRVFQSGPTRHCNTKSHTASMAIKQLNREPNLSLSHPLLKNKLIHHFERQQLEKVSHLFPQPEVFCYQCKCWWPHSTPHSVTRSEVRISPHYCWPVQGECVSRRIVHNGTQ